MSDLRTYKNTEAQPVRTLSNTALGEEKQGTHTIRRGETLAGIASVHALGLSELLDANPDVNPYAYRAGTVLNIPCVKQTTECCEGRLYCVRVGDTVDSILRMFGVTESELTEANPVLLQIGLIAGQILCIPTAVEPPPPLCPGAVDQIVITQGTEFSDILIAYDISFNALQMVNPQVDLTVLTIGQTLCIPATGTRGTCAMCETPYIMQTGDTLQGIATALGASIGAIMLLNPVMLPSDFVPGAMICV